MNKKLITLVLVLACVFSAIYFRFYALSLPALGFIARQDVLEEETKAAQKLIKEKYPEISPIAQNKIMDRYMKENTNGHNPLFEARVNKRQEELRDRFSDTRGHVYMTGIDSYYWLRLLENLIKNGHIGDRVVNGVEYDDLIGAPIDKAVGKSAHIWLGFAFYRTVSLFNPDVFLPAVLFYVPLFLSVIIGVFAFFVARRLGADDLGAFFASVAINLSPFLLERSIGEWFDTDIYNVLFPLLVFGVFLFCFKSKSLIRRLLLCCLSAFFLSCYAATWKGWWFIFDIMLITYLIFVMNLKLAFADGYRDPSHPNRDAAIIKGHWLLLVFFFFVSGFFMLGMNGFNVWKDFIMEPLKLWNVLQITPQAMWPNVYRTVAELKDIQSFELMMALGGSFIFFTSLLGLLYLILFKKHVRDEEYGFGILAVTLWIIIIFCTTLQAFRFALLLVVPLGLAFGVSYTAFYKAVVEKTKNFQRQWLRYLCRFCVVAVFSVYLVSCIVGINTKLLPILPQMTDEWNDILIKIKNETPENAIINSWWDFGHWFKAIAGRRVLFDGMTQNTPYAYWMARVLLTDNENEAVGILRMINVNDNKAVDFLEKKGDIELIKAVDLIQKSCGKENKEEAYAYLIKNRVQEDTARHVADLLFPEGLPTVYFIVSYDMIAKIGAITYIGNWNFRNVDAWFKHEEFSPDEFLIYASHHYGLESSEVQDLNLEISLLSDDEARTWFSRAMLHTSSLSEVSKKDGDLLFFANGLVVDLKNYHAYVASEFLEKQGTPEYLFYMRDNKFIEVAQDQSNKTFSALLVSKDDSYQSILTDALVARSMLARLYFFKGRGLDCFKLFAQTQDKEGNAIYCYKIEWPRESANSRASDKQQGANVKR